MGQVLSIAAWCRNALTLLGRVCPAAALELCLGGRYSFSNQANASASSSAFVAVVEATAILAPRMIVSSILLEDMMETPG
jgi:hypothetical protein